MARVRELGIEGHVVFLDRFVDLATLLEFISMCDVYVTPYLNEAQMTSGTLAYSFGLGKPVVSTPYWHARELLADGCGILVPFGDTAAIGSEIAQLLTDHVRRQAMSRRPRSSPAPTSARRSHAASCRRTCRSATSCRCATIPACSSTPSIRCPIARTATASTTMPGRCCWPAR
jgi:glycosyltransferase involved in cell wall biosynthesis